MALNEVTITRAIVETYTTPFTVTDDVSSKSDNKSTFTLVDHPETTPKANNKTDTSPESPESSGANAFVSP